MPARGIVGMTGTNNNASPRPSLPPHRPAPGISGRAAKHSGIKKGEPELSFFGIWWVVQDSNLRPIG